MTAEQWLHISSLKKWYTSRVEYLIKFLMTVLFYFLTQGARKWKVITNVFFFSSGQWTRRRDSYAKHPATYFSRPLLQMLPNISQLQDPVRLRARSTEANSFLSSATCTSCHNHYLNEVFVCQWIPTAVNKAIKMR